MQASIEGKLNPADHQFYSEAKISEDFYAHLKLTGHLQDDDRDENDDVEEEDEVDEDEDEVDEDEDEEEFSFNCGELRTSPITAEDAFVNGQIKPVFPLFNRDLSFSGNDFRGNLPAKPPVKKIFVETSGGDDGDNSNNGQAMASCGPGSDEIVGPYCEWSSRKAVEASPPAQVCKKSNSTGFSKIWRFRELVGRCNSDGRDAFVFLNGGGQAPQPPPPAEEMTDRKSSKTKRAAKKGGKTAPVSAHEAYLKSKGKEEEERRRSTYLPYRPELMGFFTNVNGGLSKNVHPF